MLHLLKFIVQYTLYVLPLDSPLATPLSKHACVQGRGGDRQATRPPPPPPSNDEVFT